MNDDLFRNEAREPALGGKPTMRPDLTDPQVVLSLLEADQVVAAKLQTRFGRRRLTLGTRVLMWGLRVYVFVMLVIVIISVVHALHG